MLPLQTVELLIHFTALNKAENKDELSACFTQNNIQFKLDFDFSRILIKILKNCACMVKYLLSSHLLILLE